MKILEYNYNNSNLKCQLLIHTKYCNNSKLKTFINYNIIILEQCNQTPYQFKH